MFEQFRNHPELKWNASPAGQFYSDADRLNININLKDFTLERIVDLREQVENEGSAKLMLIGSSNTNIFVYGPNNLINLLYHTLQRYKARFWSKIINITLNDHQNCANLLVPTKCDPWVIDKLELKEMKRGAVTPCTTTSDLEKIYEICVHCENFLKERDLR